MRGLNKVTLIGNVGKDPEVKIIEGDIKVARFSLATSDTYKDANGQKHTNTEWHNIILWRSLADLAENYISKGSSIYVEGKLKTRTFESKEGLKKSVTEIIAEQVILLDKKEI